MVPSPMAVPHIATPVAVQVRMRRDRICVRRPSVERASRVCVERAGQYTVMPCAEMYAARLELEDDQIGS